MIETMQVSYGSPGHRGVTHLMAVGADDYDDTKTTMRRGVIASLLVAAVGAMIDKPGLVTAGIGGAIAIAGASYAINRAHQVPVTTPTVAASSATPAATSGYGYVDGNGNVRRYR